jgi:hypothetical protein
VLDIWLDEEHSHAYEVNEKTKVGALHKLIAVDEKVRDKKHEYALYLEYENEKGGMYHQSTSKAPSKHHPTLQQR